VALRSVIADRYELAELLGKGGMGEVWAGFDRRLDRKVAVKFIRSPDGRPDDELTRRFVRESRITARIEHPGVPIVYDAGKHRDDLYIVMQLVRGITVADLVAEQHRLPVGWAAGIAAQTCAVLDVAHRHSLIHRDLKPNNLILCPDGSVKVLDFGLAAAFEPGQHSRITGTGQILGTPAFMAPEQAIAGSSGPQCDLYALGCMLHEMITGETVFAARTAIAMLYKQVHERPQPLRSSRPGIDPELESLVLHLLAKKPEDRPSSAAEVYARLLPFATSLGPLGDAVLPSAEQSAVRMYATLIDRVCASGSPATPALPDGRSRDHGAETWVDYRSLERSDLRRARDEASKLTRSARFSQAAETLVDMVEPATKVFGADDSDVLSLRLELANVRFYGGDYRTAAPEFRQIAADLARQRGADDELALRCRLQEATCHAAVGETAEALRQLQVLLADEERVFGPNDARPLELRRQIGLLLLGTGETAKARARLSVLHDDFVRLHGPDHPTVRELDERLSGLDRAERES
jgi:serine/threonine protein kinase